MTSLIIAEKPSAALKIANSLADGKVEAHNNKKVSYYEITHNKKKLAIACAVGHLYNLAEKEKKGWTYPVFDIEWKPSYETSKSSAFTKPYLEVIRKLSKDATEIYNACDLDIEGETIFKNILNFACHKKDAKRMKFSTTTKEDLVNAYENADEHINFKLAEAGETRHFLDHYWGINLSRALTLSVKSATGMFKILSSGRVQGPALKILAERELQIKSFKPVPYWQVELFTKDFNAFHEEDKIFDKGKAEEIFQKANVKKATISSVEKQRFKQDPPHPFDLTALQLEAYRQLGISPKETLSICQDLYTNSYISYPRTSSNQLPESIGYRKIMEKLSKQEQYKLLCQKLLKLNSLKPNNGKKTDPAHPAIYATGEVPSGLEVGARKVYDLIVRRILATFADQAERESVFVEIDANGEKFNTKGVTTIYKGWHEYYGTYARFEEIELPPLEQGQQIDVNDLKIYDKETTPPKRYSPASVIKALESRGLGTKSVSGDTLVYINGKWLPIKKLFNLGKRTNEKLLVKIPYATFYDLSMKKLGLKKDILVAKRFKEQNEKIYSIETPFTKLMSDSEHKYFLIDEEGNISEKKGGFICMGESLLFTQLYNFGDALITKDWIESLKRKYKLQE